MYLELILHFVQLMASPLLFGMDQRNYVNTWQSRFALILCFSCWCKNSVLMERPSMFFLAPLYLLHTILSPVLALGTSSSSTLTPSISCVYFVNACTLCWRLNLDLCSSRFTKKRCLNNVSHKLNTELNNQSQSSAIIWDIPFLYKDLLFSLLDTCIRFASF